MTKSKTEGKQKCMTSPDFTEGRYEELLTRAAAKYCFNGSDMDESQPSVCWRHDVDYSPHRALAFARAENRQGLRCVYHLLVTSRYYNLLEPEIAGICREIATLGHEIGLHFDIDVLQENCRGHEAFLARIRFEKEIVAGILSVEPVSLSFHNHSLHAAQILQMPVVEGMRNLACSDFFDEMKYVSDSNGIWRRDHLDEVLSSPAFPKLHVLTHPVWWTPEALSPYARFLRAVNGRAEANRYLYLRMMIRDGRLCEIGRLLGITEADIQRAAADHGSD